jgi:hypothetical protein
MSHSMADSRILSSAQVPDSPGSAARVYGYYYWWYYSIPASSCHAPGKHR